MLVNIYKQLNKLQIMKKIPCKLTPSNNEMCNYILSSPRERIVKLSFRPGTPPDGWSPMPDSNQFVKLKSGLTYCLHNPYSLKILSSLKPRPCPNTQSSGGDKVASCMFQIYILE